MVQFRAFLFLSNIFHFLLREKPSQLMINNANILYTYGEH